MKSIALYNSMRKGHLSNIPDVDKQCEHTVSIYNFSKPSFIASVDYFQKLNR